MATVTVPARFNGPPASGNGGYACGVLAVAAGGPVAVSLRRPVPLDRELEIQHEDVALARAFCDGELIAEARSAAPLRTWDGPRIGLEEAHISHEKYVSRPGGEFDSCFVCGQARDDGMRIFAGPVADTGIVASPWTPPAWTADEAGAVRPEFVWAALDCPAYFALHGDELTIAYLVRQQVEIASRPRAGAEHVVVGRPLERSGRKGLAATAVLDLEGEVLAHAEVLFVVPREAAA
ncbi:MAG: hypothetical protein JSS68_05260 [Actinobacteria bacterium]|nr:hypothetical protein [Actinomycetota bacterium]